MVGGQRTDNGQTDDGPWLYYKLTNEPKGSGELIINTQTKLLHSTNNVIVLSVSHSGLLKY